MINPMDGGMVVHDHTVICVYDKPESGYYRILDAAGFLRGKGLKEMRRNRRCILSKMRCGVFQDQKGEIY